MKKNEIIRIIKFILFSLSAGMIEAVTFAVMNEAFELPYWPCYLVALLLSIV